MLLARTREADEPRSVDQHFWAQQMCVDSVLPSTHGRRGRIGDGDGDIRSGVFTISCWKQGKPGANVAQRGGICVPRRQELSGWCLASGVKGAEKQNGRASRALSARTYTGASAETALEIE